jgi:hypothetical protein
MTAEEALDIASLLDSLQTHEYLSRKYRVKGDEWYEMGNNRFSMEYHNLAAEEDRRIRAILIELESKLGPAGSILSPGSEGIEDRRVKADHSPVPGVRRRTVILTAPVFMRATRGGPG